MLDRRGDFLVVDNGDLRIVFWPGCGGRLISLRIRGREVLWANPAYLDGGPALTKPREDWPPLDGTMASWANVGGSKTWPAPQGWSGPAEWAGPPDPILDSGVWSCRSTVDRDGAHVRMTSPFDPRTGLVVEREFRVPEAGSEFRQLNRFTNAGEQAVRWSIWEVCQVDASLPGSLVRVGADDDRPPRVLLSVVGAPELGDLVEDEWVIPIVDTIGKLGFPSANRHIALVRPDGLALQICFDAESATGYPDGGCRAGLWLQFPLDAPVPELDGLHPDARLVELEVLGPLADLEPGESKELELTWRVMGKP